MKINSTKRNFEGQWPNLLLVALLVIVACSNKVAHIPEIDPEQLRNKAVSQPSTEKTYKMVPYDLITIRFTYHPEQDPKTPVAVRPDGHIIPFPALFETYEEMLEKYQYFEGKLPLSEQEYRWKFIDGTVERKWLGVLQDNPRINMVIEMRSPQVKFLDGKYMMFETPDAEILDLEHLRAEMKDKEGDINTFLTIQHQTDPHRQQRVDLLQVPAFFFPSQAL